MGDIQKIKQRVLEIAKDSYNMGLFAGTSGNLSVMDREKNLIVITPSSIRYGDMTLDDLVTIDIDGNIIEGNRRPSSEWKMHTAIYKEREDVNAVFHTHSPYATSFAVTRSSIPVILIEMIPFIGGDIPVAKMALPGSEDMGTEALKALSNRNACLLSNHGVLTIGKTIEEAFIRAEYTEDSAKIFHHSKVAGEVNLVPKVLIEKMNNKRKKSAK